MILDRESSYVYNLPVSIEFGTTLDYDYSLLVSEEFSRTSDQGHTPLVDTPHKEKREDMRLFQVQIHNHSLKYQSLFFKIMYHSPLKQYTFANLGI